MFDATGMSQPVGFSNSSAGPPPGSLHTRSVTAAISRSGLTGSAMRERSFRLSRSVMKSLRSGYKSSFSCLSCFRVFRDFSVLHRGPYLIGNRLRDLERASARFSGHHRRAARDNGADKVHQLALQRLLVRDLELAAVDRRTALGGVDQPPHLHFLRRVVDRHIRGGLEEAD